MLAPLAVVGLVVGLWAFQPWRVFTSSTLDEALPSVTTTPAGSEPAATAVPGAPPPVASQPAPAPASPVVLAEGQFVSQEHETTGSARVIELPDGSRVLRLESFATSDGPDVHVWLTDQTADAPWDSYDDGRYVALGKLKATNGHQNYPIPPDASLAGLRSVVIWCDRFNVPFGSATLAL